MLEPKRFPKPENYRNKVCKTLSSRSARGSSGRLRPCSSKRGGSSIVASLVSEPGLSSRRCRLRSRPDSRVLLDRSSSLRRLCRLCPCSSSCSYLCSCVEEDSLVGSSCGLRSNLTVFSVEGTGLGASGVFIRYGHQDDAVVDCNGALDVEEHMDCRNSCHRVVELD